MDSFIGERSSPCINRAVNEEEEHDEGEAGDDMEAHILNLMQGLSDERMQRIIMKSLAARPSLRSVTALDGWAETAGGIVVVPKQLIEIIPTDAALNYVTEGILWKTVLFAFAATVFFVSYVIQLVLTGGYTVPALLTLVGAMASSCAWAFCLLHVVNAVLFWDFVCSFDFGMLGANVLRLVLALEANEWRSHGGLNLAYGVQVVCAMVITMGVLSIFASLDALTAADAGWNARLRKVKVFGLGCSLLAWSLLLWVTTFTDLYPWQNGTEVVLWFLTLTPKKHFQAGASYTVIYICKFCWNIIARHQDFTVKRATLKVLRPPQLSRTWASSGELEICGT